MKTISAQLQTHMEQTVTTMCTCWKLVKKDGTSQGFTNHAEDFTYEGLLYEASTGFTPSNIASTENLAVDNMEIVGFLDSSSISRDALIAGEYDQAEVYVFMVNYEDLTMGNLKLSYGTLGEVRSGRVVFEAEFRGLTQKLDQTIGEVYSVTCRADLGDSRCGIRVSADRWVPRTLVAVGAYIRASLANSTNRVFKVTTGGYTASVEPSWDTTPTNPTSETGLEIVEDGIFANTLGIKWNEDGAEWSWAAGVITCDGTQTVNTFVTQDTELAIDPVQGTPYTTSFDLVDPAVELTSNGDFASGDTGWTKGTGWAIPGTFASCDGTQVAATYLGQTPATALKQVDYDTSFYLGSYVAGNVRIVIGGTAGAWRSADGTHTETISAGAGTDIELEGDSNFDGDLDDISVIESLSGQVRIVIGGVAGTWRTAGGTHTEDITAGASVSVAIEGDPAFNGRIDNVSVIEKADADYETETSWLEIGTITTVNTNENFIDTGRTEANNYFDRGFFTLTTGANAGLSREIKTFASDTFQLALPFPYDVQVGDKYEVYRGCNKTTAECISVFSNVVNFRGEPFIPGIDEVSKFGGQ